MYAQTADVSTAGGGATWRASAAAHWHAATVQGHTAPTPINAMSWGAVQSRALSAAPPKRSALTAKETTSHSAAGVQRWLRQPGRHGRGGKETKQDKPHRPRDQPRGANRTILCFRVRAPEGGERGRSEVEMSDA
jgi:hypothetical protein